ASLLCCIALVLTVMQPCLHVGFLLDDYKHLDHACHIFHGEGTPAQHLLRALQGLNFCWHSAVTGQTDGLTSFRPAITLSIWADYFLWGMRAFGFHLANLLFFSGCA